MRKFIYIYLFVIICLANSCQKKEEKSIKDNIPEIEVLLPRIDSVTLTESYPGNLVALREVDIMARVDGVITGVYAQSGDKVKEGQLLYTIEDSKYRDLLQQAKASLATATSSHEYYSRQYDAMQKAFKDEAVSEIELLQSKSNLEQSEAQIENCKAAVASAEMMLGYCQIRAPFDGVLSLQQYDLDAYVNGETTPVKLNTLYNDETLHAYISISEKEYLQILSNERNRNLCLDSVEVTFTETLPHKYFSTLNYTSPEINATTGTVTLRFNLDNKYSELKPGMYVKVAVPYDIDVNALIINDASIGTDQHGKYVYLVDKDDKIVYAPIEVGPTYQDTLRIVKSGLTKDSRYVKDALLKVRDGMQVKSKLVR